MSQVRTKLNMNNPGGFYLTYPIAGVNNSSQGFRDHWKAISDSVIQADTELSTLQNTKITFSGDLQGTSGLLSSAGLSGTEYILNIAVNLPTITGLTAFTHNTTQQDRIFTFDNKGRLTAAAPATHSITWNASHSVNNPINATINTTNMGTGTGTLTIPALTFNPLGRLIGTSTSTFQYGLLDHPMAAGSILIGSSTGRSSLLHAPSGNSVLSYNGTNVVWASMATGSVTGITSGPGVDASTSTVSPQVSLNYNTLTADNAIVSADIISWQRTGVNVPYKMTFSDFQNSIVKVEIDTAPRLGGDLVVNGFKMVSDDTQGIVLQSAPAAPTSSVTINQTMLALQSDQLLLNGFVWPDTGTGTQGQFLTRGSGGVLQWTTPQAFYQNIPFTVFVSNDGSDTAGNGSMNNPYETIAKALSEIPNNSSDVYTIMLLGGSFSEDVLIESKKNISIEGFYTASFTIITGVMMVSSGCDFFRMSNICIDNSARSSSDMQANFTLLFSVESFEVRNCAFLRGAANTDLSVIDLFGTMTNNVMFDNILIQGRVSNNTSTDGGRLVLNNILAPADGWMSLFTSSGSNTYLNNVALIKGIEHTGGSLVIDNVTSIIPREYSVTTYPPYFPVWDDTVVPNEPIFEFDYNTNSIMLYLDVDGFPSTTLLLDPTGNPIPDPNDPAEFLMTPYVQTTAQGPGVVTTFEVGIYSTADTDPDYNHYLELNNVNLFYNGEFSKVYKTGDCPWVFNRVKRRGDFDVINGPRISYDLQPDKGNFVAQYDASGTNLVASDDVSVTILDNMLDPQTNNVYDIVLKGPSIVTIKTPETTSYNPGPQPFSGEMVYEMTVFVEQDNVGSRTLSFAVQGGNLKWLTNSTVDSNPLSITIYQFKYFAKTRQWIAYKEIDNTADLLVIRNLTSNNHPLTILDSGKYVRLTDGTAVTVTVPLANDVNFTIGSQIHVVQAGTGQVTFVGDTGVTINSPGGLALRTQFSKATLTKVANNIWDIDGDLTGMGAPTADME